MPKGFDLFGDLDAGMASDDKLWVIIPAIAHPVPAITVPAFPALGYTKLVYRATFFYVNIPDSDAYTGPSVMKFRSSENQPPNQ